MSKKQFLSCVLIIFTVIFSFAGCGANSVNFYFCISENFEKNTKLESDSVQTIKQNKEKIKDSMLTFNRNDDESFDNMYLCFSGNNIESVTASSENKTILYDNYKIISNCLEVFKFYYYVDESKIDEYFDAEQDLVSTWESGQLDDVRNVYFNGLSIYDISRSRRDPAKEIGSVNANLYGYPELEYSDYKLYYLDELKTVEKPVVYVQIDINSTKEMPEDEADVISQGKSVKSNQNVNTDSFIYRYEKLFYNSQQKALKEKNSFDYSDLCGETIQLNVKYTDGSVQNFSLDVSFDKNGNIVAKLRESK